MVWRGGWCEGVRRGREKEREREHLTHSRTHALPPSLVLNLLLLQVRRADFEAHVGRMRQEYERAMKQKIQRCVPMCRYA